MTRATTAILVAVAGGAALAGCRDPYANHRANPTPPPQAAAAARDDLSAPLPAARRRPRAPSRPSHAPQAIARSFAMRWINWDWRIAVRQQRVLARLAADDLARTLVANSRSARIDATLARDKPGSRGTVATIDLNQTGTRAAGLVVTHEQTSTDGRADLGGERYRVYVIALRRDSGNWRMIRWAPQP